MNKYWVTGVHKHTKENFAASFIADNEQAVKDQFDLSGIDRVLITNLGTANLAYCLGATHHVMSKI